MLLRKGWNKDVKITVEGNSVIAKHPEGEIVIVTFRPDIKVSQEKITILLSQRKVVMKPMLQCLFYYGERDNC